MSAVRSLAGISVVVPAAGIGSRLSSQIPKQYLTLQGKTVLEVTLARLLALRPDRLVLVVGASDERYQQIPLVDACEVVTGGELRSDSVMSGLVALDIAASEFVMVHDAVRPCVCAEDVNRLIDAVDFQPPGGLLASPVNDTLKSADEAAQVTQTVPSANLWRAQTPQLFPVRLLQEALIQAGNQKLECTDDAQAIEHMGFHPKIVACADHNLKITQRSDLALACAILSQQESNACSG